jgi:hypothetical protein
MGQNLQCSSVGLDIDEVKNWFTHQMSKWLVCQALLLPVGKFPFLTLCLLGNRVLEVEVWSLAEEIESKINFDCETMDTNDLFDEATVKQGKCSSKNLAK